VTEDRREEPVFSPEGIRRLLAEGGERDLNEDEKALLLALVEADSETGRSLSEKELAALESLKSQVEGYDAEEVIQAVKHMITGQAREGARLEWPELEREWRKRDTPKE
jgi:hypothetical protein